MKRILKPILPLLALVPIFWANPLAAEDKPEATKQLPEIARFFLSGDPKFGIYTPKEGQLETGIPTRIKVVPGLSDPKCVSLMTDRNVYLRHQFWKFKLEKRPEGEEERKSFDADATFNVIYLANGEVKFEAANRPGEFMAVETDGKISLSKVADLRMSFRVEGKAK